MIEISEINLNRRYFDLHVRPRADVFHALNHSRKNYLRRTIVALQVDGFLSVDCGQEQFPRDCRSADDLRAIINRQKTGFIDKLSSFFCRARVSARACFFRLTTDRRLPFPYSVLSPQSSELSPFTQRTPTRT
jgi:hypothetical protein